MLRLSVILAVLAISAIVLARPEEQFYKTRLDTLDVDKILTNDRLVDNYIKCIQDKGKCTPEGRELKTLLQDLLQEALKTNCGKCTETQKEKMYKILKHLRDKKNKEYIEILNKFDPDMALRKAYKEMKFEVSDKQKEFPEIFDV